MRITGGQWRGRRLEAVKGLDVRPTTDRAREALFNILRHEIQDAEVVDCCCGTGALGLEALSRGARHVDFIDVAPRSLQTVRLNLERLGAEPTAFAVHRGDAARWLEKRLTAGAVGDLIVLADPPYGGPVPDALLSVLAAGAAPAVLVLEHPSQEALAVPVPERWRLDRRSYGSSAFTIIRPCEPDQPEHADA